MINKTISLWFGAVLLVTLMGCGNEREVALTLADTQPLDPCRMLKKETSGQSLQVYVDGLKQLAQEGEPCAQYGLGTLYTMGYQSILQPPREANKLSEEYDNGDDLLGLVAE